MLKIGDNLIWYGTLCSKINFKVKYTRAKDFLNEINCKQPLISNTVYERWHSKLFINCHVSWIVGHPVHITFWTVTFSPPLIKLRAAVVHLNFRDGSTFPVPVCTVPSSMDRTSRCNKVDVVRLMLHIGSINFYQRGRVKKMSLFSIFQYFLSISPMSLHGA